MSSGKHILDYVYANEKKYAGKTWFTQPVSAGNVSTYSWSDAMTQVRAMVSHLHSLDLEPGSKIAMISKNCAHFMMAELAIWMAGHVTVALYPTLNAETASFRLVGASLVTARLLGTSVGHAVASRLCRLVALGLLAEL